MVNLISIARKNIIFCKDDDTIDIIAKIMVDHNIGSVLVKNVNSDEYIGLIDDRMLFRLLTIGENPIPKKAKDVMKPLNIIDGNYDIEKAWEKMQIVEDERFCVVDENERVVGIVKRQTIGYLRLKYLKQQLGIVDL